MLIAIKNLLNRYDTAIWIRILGTAMTTICGFMIRPFLVLYLYEKLEGSIILPLLIVSLQPLVGMAVSLWGGGLSDRIGRKPLMVSALVIQLMSMLGFMFAESVWEFALYSTFNGLGMSLFFPAANAQVADVVPDHRRAEVFAALHTALNVGAAAGPMLGLVLFNRDPAFVFGLSAAALLIYMLLVIWKVPETLPAELKHSKGRAKNDSPKPSLRFSEHKTLYLMTILMVPVSILYASVETIFPLHMKDQFENYKIMFAWMMTLNGAIVMLSQIWVANRTEHAATFKVVCVAYALIALTSIGYGFAPFFILLLISETLFSIGEMLIGPHMQKAVSRIAPKEMRGRYFSIFGLHWQSSRAFTPILFGFIYQQWGGQATFAVIAGLIAVSGIFQYKLVKSISAASETEIQETAAITQSTTTVIPPASPPAAPSV